MSEKPSVSRRGVYYDLTKSPYEFKTPHGDLLKFSSKKKLEIYTRDVSKELDRLNTIMQRNDLWKFVPDEIKQLLKRAVYKSFYKKIEG